MKALMDHRIVAVVAVLALLLAAPARGDEAWSHEDAAHLLRRAGFGGTPEQIDQLFALGKAGAVDYLVDGKLPKGGKPIFAPAQLDPFKADPPAADADVQEIQRANRQAVQKLRVWWVDRMLRTDKPLEEKMTVFWHGLFTSGAKEVKIGGALVQQVELFHANAMGNYRMLTESILHDPAMLKYLNADDNAVGKPNENLARELMELFTMGEGNGYTEKDIGEVARCLTGLGVQGRRGLGTATYVFRPARHDRGMKTVFGRSGNFMPEDVVSLIFTRPIPAQHLAERLWTFFAYPGATPAELYPVTQALLRTNYDVKAALRAIFMSPAFYSEKAKFAIIKNPIDLTVGTMRVLNAASPRPVDATRIAQDMNQMGMTLLQPPNVKGWVGGEHWITSGTLYARYNTASSMVDGLIGMPAAPQELFPKLDTKVKADALVDAAIARFLQRPLHPDKRQVLIDALGKAPLVMGRPETDRRVRQMLALLLSTPEYQVE